MAGLASDLNAVQVRLRNAIYLYPMQRRVIELTNIMAECSLKDLQVFFPFLVEHIFGVNPSYGNGWNLLRTSRRNNIGDFEALFRFLHPFGPFFDMIYKLLGDVYLKYEYPLTFLSVRLKQIILDGSVPSFYVDKLQIDPNLREPTALTLNAFEFYLFHFAYHLINSWQVHVDSGFFGGHETVYLHLSDQYLKHFLPIETSLVLPIVPAHQTMQIPRSPPPLQTQPQKTPKVFKTSVVKLGSATLSPTTVSQTHAEIWRSEAFVQIIINFWLSVPEQSVTANPFVNMKSQKFYGYPYGFIYGPVSPYPIMQYHYHPPDEGSSSAQQWIFSSTEFALPLKNNIFFPAQNSSSGYSSANSQYNCNSPLPLTFSKSFLVVSCSRWRAHRQDLRTSEEMLPKEDHLRVVRNMIKHIHYFVNNIHNDGSSMDELRKAITSLCRRPLYIFLRRHIYHWPLDSSFLLILETYLSFIQPWRYIKYNSSASGESNYVDSKWFSFIVENFPAYTILIREIIPRFSRMDLTSPKHAHMLFRLSKVLSQPNLVNILKDIEGHLEDSNTTGHEASQVGTPKSPCTPGTPTSPNSISFPWFNRLNVIIRQEIQELESPNFQYKTLFGQEFHQQVYEFVMSIQQSLSLVKYLLNSALAQRKIREENFIQRIKDFFFYSPTGDDYTVDERQKTVTYLEHSVMFLSQVFDLPPLQIPTENKNDVSSSSMNSSCSQQFAAVEPTVINPKDWQKRTKLIRYESNPDLEPIRSTEITFLVRFLHHLSTRINEKYKTELQELWDRTDFWGDVARHLLAPPCKFYYFDKTVPGNFAPRVPNHLPARVCLRTLASHQTLSYIFLSGVLAFFYGYPVIPFYIFMFFLFVCLILGRALLERYFSNRRRAARSPQPELERFVPLDVSFTD